jgi:aspartate/methionine/tyrosine aminotransferase
MITTADRLGNLQEYYFSQKLRQIAELNAQGYDILNLGIGSPDRAPDAHVIATLHLSAQKGNAHGYQSYKGIPNLRKAFADWYARDFQVTLNPETEILPLIGSKEGIFHIAMTYLNPGDEVLVPNPGYPSYGATAQLAGATIRSFDLKESLNWQPDLDELEQSDLSKVKLMWVNYPNMPTGAQADLAFFKKLVAFAERNDILVCNDNPYAFILNDHPMSLLASGLTDHVIELNSLSKSHNMAGWRMGMVAATKTHIDNILRFKSNLDSGMFLPIQQAAVEALSLGKDWFADLNKEYAERRKIAAEILTLLSCAYDQKQVGLFLWARVPDRVQEVEPWVDDILLNARVFLTPGFIFGSNGARFIRISLCSTQEAFAEALVRIKKHLAA